MEKSVGAPWTPLPSELETRWGVSLSRIGAHLHLPQIDRCRSLKTRGHTQKRFQRKMVSPNRRNK